MYNYHALLGLLGQYAKDGGEKTSFANYFKGSLSDHLVGILGGVIWCVGMSFSIISAELAGPAISYGLGQGATLVAAVWGIFIWREFKNPSANVKIKLTLMFLFYISGLCLIILAGH